MANVLTNLSIKENSKVYIIFSNKTTANKCTYYFIPDDGFTFDNSIPYLDVSYGDIYGSENIEKIYATKQTGVYYQSKVVEYAIQDFVWDTYENEKSLDWNLTEVTYQPYAFAKIKSPEPKPPEPEPKTGKIVYNTDSLSGCNLSKNPDDTDISVSHNFKLTAFSGYTFTNTVPTLSIFYNDSNGIENELKENFIKVSDTEYNLSYIFNVSDWDNGLVTFIFNGVAIVNTYTKQAYGTAQLYLLSDDNLSEFAKKRDFTNENNDIGKFVISLNKVFCAIPDSELTDTTLKLGSQDTLINCKTVNSLSMRLNCGSVLIPNIINIDCNIQLFLPFLGVQDITNYKQEISGKTLKLYYDVVLANGQTIATLECENLKLYYELSIAYEIPYFLNTFNNADISTTYSINAKFLSGKVPYVYIITNKPQNFNIGGVRDIDVSEIKQLLKEGVIL